MQLSDQLKTCVIGCMCILALPVIIGLPIYFMGCNTDINGACIAYNKFSGIVYKTEIVRLNTVVGNIYAHDAYNNTCIIQLNNDINNQLTHYPIGTHVNWLKQKGTDNCFRSQYDLWLIGLIFLSFAAAIYTFISICFCIGFCHTQKHIRTSIQQEEKMENTIEFNNNLNV